MLKAAFRTLTADDLQPGDVLLSQGVSATGALIAYLDWSPFSHAALWTGESVIEAVPDHVVERSLLESVNDGHRGYVIAYRRKQSAPVAGPAVVAAARGMLGAHYPLSDVLQLAFLLGTKRKIRPWNQEEALRFRSLLPGLLARAHALEQRGACPGMTCSEFVATSFAKAHDGRYRLQLAPLEGDLLRGGPTAGEDAPERTSIGDPDWDCLVESCSRVAELHRKLRAAEDADPYRAALAASIDPLRLVTPKDLSNSENLKCVGLLVRYTLARSQVTAPPAPALAGNAAPALAPALPTRFTVAIQPPASQGLKRLLFVSATPAGSAYVGSEKEWKLFCSSLLQSAHKDQFEILQPALHASLLDVAAAIAQTSPALLHFAGHGQANGLLLIGNDDTASALEEHELATMLRDGVERVQLVVLNACNTADYARRLAAQVPCVIGMSGRISASEAQRFTSALYDGLGKGLTLRVAFLCANKILEGTEAAPILAEREECAADRLRLVEPASAAIEGEPVRRRPGTVWFAGAAATALALSTLAAVNTRVFPGSTSPPALVSTVLPQSTRKLLSATPVVVVEWGKLVPGSDLAEARAAYASCLQQRPGDGLYLCGPSFEGSLFARETTNVAPIEVARFQMERHEVSNAQFVAWLNAEASELVVESDPKRLSTLKLPLSAVLDGEDWLTLVGVEGESAVLPDTALSITHGKGGFHVAPGREHLPVRMVSRRGALRYCAALGRRLPTAAEWEWAARGPQRRPYAWGFQPKSCTQVVFDRAMNGACPQLAAAPAPVASSEDVTPEGIYDLGGNVSEWIDSSYHDPNVMMVRGGHFGDPLAMLGAARIFRAQRGDLYRQLGFRCVQSD